ncbi:hypothetical protein Bbelb_392570 [Branchiostoma belcheri]|nr:hypothetical protein Bbelb_392570 [Branchiostoma belcheri]
MKIYELLLMLAAVVTAAHTQTCDFDLGWCDWTDNNGQMRWSRLDTYGPNYGIHAMNPMFPGSGPGDDHTQPEEYEGFYVLSSCGGSVQPGDVATITSPDIIGPCTLEFWYTMYGVDLDMSVYLLQKGQKTQVWHMADVNEDFWQRASVTLSPPMEEAYQVVFESVKGTNFLCNVAFDDVKLAPAPLLKCDFESTGPCALRQDVSDVFDWRWQQGMTDTREDILNRNLTAIAPDILTGPEYDVTLGPGGSGTYMYVESSVQSAGHHARLSSTELSGQCLEFYFHMLGRHSGTLKVFQQSVYQNDTTEQLIWEVSGSHGDVWHRAAVSLNITNNFYIRFEAEVGGYYSNIAIDEPCECLLTLAAPPVLALVAGGWGAWEDWTECDAECDGGTQSRAAYCENPYPVFGHFCEGDDDGDMRRVEVRTCNTQPCTTTAVPTTPPKTTSETTVETTTVTTPEPTTTAQTTTMETTTEAEVETTMELTTDSATTAGVTTGHYKTTTEVTKAITDNTLQPTKVVNTLKPGSFEAENAPVCTNEYMELALPAHRLTHVVTSGLHWDPDPSCKATFNGTHYILRTGLYQCGTKPGLLQAHPSLPELGPLAAQSLQRALCCRPSAVAVTFDSKYVIFYNNVSLLFTHDGVITRDPDVVIHSVCKYDREEAVMSEFLPIPGGLEFVDEGFGQLSIRLDLFPTQSYLAPYTTTEYPVHKHLRDMICASDDTLQFYARPDPSTQRFGLEAFRFVQEVTTVHIRCEVEVCDAADTGSRCEQGCRTNRHHKRALEDADDIKNRYVISQGPIIFSADSQQGASAKNAAIAVGGSAVVIALAAVLLIVKVRRSKRVHPGYEPLSTLDAEADQDTNKLTCHSTSFTNTPLPSPDVVYVNTSVSRTNGEEKNKSSAMATLLTSSRRGLTAGHHRCDFFPRTTGLDFSPGRLELYEDKLRSVVSSGYIFRWEKSMEYGILRQDGRMTGTKMQVYRFLLTLAAVATAARGQSCDFDLGWCDWTDNNGQMEWGRLDTVGPNYGLHAVNPMFPGSGPGDDHTQPVSCCLL